MITKEESENLRELLQGVTEETNEVVKEVQLPEGMTKEEIDLMQADALITIFLNVIEERLDGWDDLSETIIKIFQGKAIATMVLLMDGLQKHQKRVEEIKKSQGFQDFQKSK